MPADLFDDLKKALNVFVNEPYVFSDSFVCWYIFALRSWTENGSIHCVVDLLLICWKYVDYVV